MGNQYFRFKQFTIFQDRCAMKVGADGVTLGAWCNVNGATNILDVGCGTGLLTLMIAQRMPESNITAIDIDADCVSQTVGNCEKSPFNKQITVQHISIQDFANQIDIKFDAIVSNPPYFNNSLKSFSSHRNLARHSDSLPHEELILSAKKILNFTGRLFLILPVKEGEEMIKTAKKSGFFCSEKIFVYPNFRKEAKRLLLEFQLQECETKTGKIVVEKERGIYTESYAKMVKDYYLAL